MSEQEKIEDFYCPGHKNGADQGYNTTTHYICEPVREKIAAALRASQERNAALTDLMARELSALSSANHGLHGQIAALKAELAEAEKLIEVLKTICQDRESVNQMLRLAMDMTEGKKYASAVSMLGKVMTENRENREAREKAEAEVRTQAQQIAFLERERVEKLRMVDVLTAEVERLRHTVSAKQVKASNLADGLEKTLAERDALARVVAQKDRILEAIANPQCGCRPKCTCLEPASLDAFRSWARDVAGEALALTPKENTNG